MNLNDPITTTFVLASNNRFTRGTHLSSPDYTNYATIFALPSYYIPGTYLNCSSPISSTSSKGLQNASCIGCQGHGYIDGSPNCEIYRMFTLVDYLDASSVRDLRGLLQSEFQRIYVKPLECRECKGSGGRYGASPADGSFVCFCLSSVAFYELLGRYNTRHIHMGRVTRKRGTRGCKAYVSVIYTSASALIVVTLVASTIVFTRRQQDNFYLDKEVISSISPKRYTYSQLKKFTNNFSSKGFSMVYKRTVELQVAVKFLKSSKQIKNWFFFFFLIG
ncbi:non-specific serine/threonine protein kinase [Ranunculus cassubicifolius]